MRICLKCLSVFATDRTRYCENDGEMTFDTISIEAKEAVEKLTNKLKGEVVKKG